MRADDDDTRVSLGIELCGLGLSAEEEEALDLHSKAAMAAARMVLHRRSIAGTDSEAALDGQSRRAAPDVGIDAADVQLECDSSSAAGAAGARQKRTRMSSPSGSPIGSPGGESEGISCGSPGGESDAAFPPHPMATEAARSKVGAPGQEGQRAAKTKTKTGKAARPSVPAAVWRRLGLARRWSRALWT